MNDQHFLKYYLDHESQLRTYVYALVKQRDQAEELFQEIVLQICAAFPNYDQHRPFLAWARGVAKNLILKRWEKNRRDALFLRPATIEALDQVFEEKGGETQVFEKRALKRCIEDLSPRSQQILGLRYGAGFKLSEIAHRMDCRQGAVNKSLFRIRQALYQCLKRQLVKGRR